MICSVAGHFNQTASGRGATYEGGETRLISVPNFCCYQELLEALQRLTDTMTLSHNSGTVGRKGLLAKCVCLEVLPCEGPAWDSNSCYTSPMWLTCSPRDYASAARWHTAVPTHHPCNLSRPGQGSGSLWPLFWPLSWCNPVALAPDALSCCRHS